MRLALDSLLPIKSLSYWRYTRMARCPLSGAYPSSVVSPTGRPSTNSRAQLIGKIFHSQMEVMHGLISTGNLTPADFRSGFNSTIEGIARDVERDAASRHLGDIRLWPELNEIYTSLKGLVEFHRQSTNKTPIKTHSEETLYSQDKLLFGQLDAFFVDEAGIDLVDYKSGAMNEGDAPKEDYVNQLYFYAYLIKENYGTYPRKLMLIGRNMETIELPGSVVRSIEIAAEMRSTLSKYNEVISTPNYLQQITKPSTDNCSRCDAKPVCQAFWKAVPDMELPQRSHAVIGTQSAVIQRGKRKGASLQLDVEQGSIRPGSLVLTQVLEERYPHLVDKIGQRLMVLNIRLLTAETSAIAETTDRTVIVQMDD